MISRRDLMALAVAAVLPTVPDIYAVYRGGRWVNVDVKEVVKGDRVYVQNEAWPNGIYATCGGWFVTTKDIDVDSRGEVIGLSARDPQPWNPKTGFVLSDSKEY